MTDLATAEQLEKWGCRTPDELTREGNKRAGHTLCEHCNGTANELYSMYRPCPKCIGGIAVKYGDLSPLGRWWSERREKRERKRLARQYAPPRDWKLEIQWRLSRWLGVGQAFHGFKDECRHCHAPAGDIDFEVRRTGPFRCECTDRGLCREMQLEQSA